MNTCFLYLYNGREMFYIIQKHRYNYLSCNFIFTIFLVVFFRSQMSFSLHYSKCETIAGLFLLNLFGYGKVKCLMVLDDAINGVWNNHWNNDFGWKLHFQFYYAMVTLYQIWKSERRHICRTTCIHCSLSLQTPVYSLSSCLTEIEVVNNVYNFLYIQIKCIFKCHDNFKFSLNQVLK